MEAQEILSVCGVSLIGAALLGSCGMLAAERLSASRRRSRLGAQGAALAVRANARASLSGVVREVKRIGDYVAPQDPNQLSVLRTKLMHAGFMQREAVTVYLGARALCLGLAVGACALLLPRIMSHNGGIGAVALTALFAGAAILGPDKVLGNLRKRLLIEYRDGFPDVLDLLVASVEAGLSMDAAVIRVAEEVGRRHPNLAKALRLLTLELRAGRSRREAWTIFAERLGLEEAMSFATMLRQAEEMGASLGETLSVFSDDMRTKRMLKAEEKALALSAKLMLPLILFLFPCLLGVLMMPAVYHLAQMIGKK